MADPYDDFDALFEEMKDEIREELSAFTAVVTGKNGGRVKVQRGDEEFTAGFSRNKGVRHQPGDPVLMIPTRSGEPVIASVLTSAEGGGEQAVDNADLFTNAVDGRALRVNAVGRDHVQTDTIEARHLRAKSITPTALDREYATADRANTILTKAQQGVDDARTAQNAASAADGRASAADGRARDAQTAASAADDRAKSAQGTADRVKEDVAVVARDVGGVTKAIKDLQERVLQLERDVKRLS